MIIEDNQDNGDGDNDCEDDEVDYVESSSLAFA